MGHGTGLRLFLRGGDVPWVYLRREEYAEGAVGGVVVSFLLSFSFLFL